MLDEIVLIGVLGVAMMATPTTAGTSQLQQPDAAVNLAVPGWSTPPSPDAVAENFPGFASAIGLSGRVSLECMAVILGPPQDCKITAVAPDGLGFEGAGLAVAATGVVRPAVVKGVPVAKRIAFRILFLTETIEETTDAPTPYTGQPPSASALALAKQIVIQDLDAIIANEEEALLDGLAPDRIEIVRRWMREKRPLGDNKYIERQALAIARLSSEDEMASYLSNGTPSQMPTEDDWMRATSDFPDEGDEAKWISLRTRYCEHWSCEIPSED